MPLDAETLEQLLDTVRRFVAERLIPREEELAEADRVPDDIVREMRELGLFGLSIPEEYGGLGLNMEEEVRVAFELGRTAPAFRSLIGTNNGIGLQGIVLDGTEEQRRKYLPRLASGEIIGSFALTEPDSGSDAASLRTTAVRDGDAYVLNGTKRYITNAPEAGLFTVMARTDPAQKGARGISTFLVEAGTPGLRLGRIDRKISQRGAHTCDVILEDCRVPAGQLIGGKEGQGFRTAMRVLDRGRLRVVRAALRRRGDGAGAGGGRGDGGPGGAGDVRLAAGAGGARARAAGAAAALPVGRRRATGPDAEAAGGADVGRDAPERLRPNRDGAHGRDHADRGAGGGRHGRAAAARRGGPGRGRRRRRNRRAVGARAERDARRLP